jgi:fumarate hydratase, class II
MTKYRIEKDSIGDVKIPIDALWGAQTQRAIDNFPISSEKIPLSIVKAIGLIKKYAAYANNELGLLDKKTADAIIAASIEIADGKLYDQFPVDIFQTGSGTSTNMNANEVIANRAIQILGGKLGDKKLVHPNDHVNMCQSSNDVFPSAIQIAAYMGIYSNLLPALQNLKEAFDKKSYEFIDVIKIGRTHLQDAVPITLGQEFSAYSSQISRSIDSLVSALLALKDLPLGGTAVGSGINAHKDFAAKVVTNLSKALKVNFRKADNLFEAVATKGPLVRVSSSLKELAVDLSKIADDIRWMGSGPHGGLGELILPELQAGSSIMPGKVNPVIPEIVLEVCAQVIGNDLAVTLGGLGSKFELNMMMPLIARNILESISLLHSSVLVFTEKCIKGLKADRKRCQGIVEQSLMLGTALTRKLGYDKVVEIAKEANKSGKTIREIILGKKLLSINELDKLLDPSKMIGK